MMGGGGGGGGGVGQGMQNFGFTTLQYFDFKQMDGFCTKAVDMCTFS